VSFQFRHQSDHERWLWSMKFLPLVTASLPAHSVRTAFAPNLP
jgi:hypothetical protein